MSMIFLMFRKNNYASIEILTMSPYREELR